jgi:hypothetical protein
MSYVGRAHRMIHKANSPIFSRWSPTQAYVSPNLSLKVSTPWDFQTRWSNEFSATKEDFDRILSVNVTGTFLCYKYAALQMIKQGRGGSILGAASMASKQGPHLFYERSASVLSTACLKVGDCLVLIVLANSLFAD